MADRTGRAGNQPADLPLPENAIQAADQVRALVHLAIVRSNVLSLQIKRSTMPQVLAAEIEQSLLPLLADVRAQGAAAERAAIQAHLRGVVADRARQGNDYVLGALLDAIRELVPAMPTTDDLLAGDAP